MSPAASEYTTVHPEASKEPWNPELGSRTSVIEAPVLRENDMICRSDNVPYFIKRNNSFHGSEKEPKNYSGENKLCGSSMACMLRNEMHTQSTHHTGRASAIVPAFRACMLKSFFGNNAMSSKRGMVGSLPCRM